MNYSNAQIEDMLNTFAMRLFGSKPCIPDEGENDDEDLANYIDSKSKSKLSRRKKKNKINKKNKKYEDNK